MKRYYCSNAMLADEGGMVEYSEAKAVIDALAKAALDVVAYDWCDNDDDAVESIEALRRALSLAAECEDYRGTRIHADSMKSTEGVRDHVTTVDNIDSSIHHSLTRETTRDLFRAAALAGVIAAEGLESTQRVASLADDYADYMMSHSK